MTTPRRKLKRWAKGAPAAYVILVVCLVVGLNAGAHHQADVLWRSQMAACGRANGLRHESNRRLRSHDYEAMVVREFLGTARKARLAAGTSTDVRTAARYKQLLAGMRTHVKFAPVAIINCRKAIPEP